MASWEQSVAAGGVGVGWRFQTASPLDLLLSTGAGNGQKGQELFWIREGYKDELPQNTEHFAE